MDALELLTVVCAVLALAAAAVLSLLCARVLRAAHALDQAVSSFTEAVEPAVEELRSAASAAVGEVERLDDLLDVANAVGDRLDTATEATYRALTSPVIKGVALASGTRRVAQRLSGRDTDRTTATATRELDPPTSDEPRGRRSRRRHT